MGEDASRFRERARQCRALAKDARDEEARRTLKEMAEELDEEAERIDAEKAAAPKIVIEPKPPG